jgi:uncharacterized membrane protein YraQ (UPF0718 family)
MNFATILMLTIAIALAILAYTKGGNLYLDGLKAGGKMAIDVLLLLIAAFIIAGYVQVLIPREFINTWFGHGSGLKGLLIASVLGGITPGGPYVSFPIVASIYKSGASIGVVVAYVTAWSLWAVARLPFEIGLIGLKFTLIRLACTFIFPPIAGLIAQILFSKVA